MHPAKIATLIEMLTRKGKELEEFIFQKNFSKSLPDKKEVTTFAPANREAIGIKNKKNTFLDILN